MRRPRSTGGKVGATSSSTRAVSTHVSPRAAATTSASETSSARTEHLAALDAAEVDEVRSRATRAGRRSVERRTRPLRAPSAAVALRIRVAVSCSPRPIDSSSAARASRAATSALTVPTSAVSSSTSIAAAISATNASRIRWSWLAGLVPVENEHVEVVDRDSALRLGAALDGIPGERLRSQPDGRPVEQHHAAKREHAAQRLEQRRDARRAAEAHEGLALGPCTRSLGRPPRCEGDEAAHDRGHDQEDDERHEIVPLGDRERVQRRREVVVREQEGDDGRREGGPHPSHRRDEHHGEQVEEEDAREPEVGSEVCQHRRQEQEGRRSRGRRRA